MPTLTQSGLPASVHTEVVILGAMLLDGMAIVDATAKLRAEDFSLASHRSIYKAILRLVEQGHGVDLTTVREELERRRELDSIGVAYFYDLTTGIPRNLNIESYCAILKGKSLMRDLMGIGSDLQIRAADPAEDALEVLQWAESNLANLGTSAVQGNLQNIPEIVAESFGSLDQLLSQGGEVNGLKTHFIDFDKMTGGLQDSELIIIAARPSIGKTALAINIAQNAALRDSKRVAIFSLEMSKEALLKRMLASDASVSPKRMQSGFIGREERGRLFSALERLMQSRLFIDDTPGISLPAMRSKSRRLQHQEKGLDLIVVDYLQLMDGGKKENRTQEVSGISRGLKALAKEMKCPVVALSQLSRQSEQRTGDKRPRLSDLRESGSIEQDADVVAFIHREEYYDRDNKDVQGKAEVIVAKQRNGPTGTIHLAWQGEYTKFENLEG